MIQRLILFCLLVIVACSPKKASSEQGDVATPPDEEEWTAMDRFHMVMAESFHPYMDSNNLAPAKSLAPEMEEMANQWANDPLPQKVNNDSMKIMIDDLRNKVKTYTELIGSEDDKKIGEALTDIHNHFHEIEKQWYKADDEMEE